jgi:hypothetical protein
MLFKGAVAMFRDVPNRPTPKECFHAREADLEDRAVQIPERA